MCAPFVWHVCVSHQCWPIQDKTKLSNVSCRFLQYVSVFKCTPHKLPGVSLKVITVKNPVHDAVKSCEISYIGVRPDNRRNRTLMFSNIINCREPRRIAWLWNIRRHFCEPRPAKTHNIIEITSWGIPPLFITAGLVIHVKTSPVESFSGIISNRSTTIMDVGRR
jgi:hypothetical protein